MSVIPQLDSPKINEDVDLTATSTEINRLHGSYPRKSIIYGSTMGAGFTVGTTQYVGLGIHTSMYLIVIPCSGTLKNLYTYTSSAPGSGKSYVYTIMKNGSATNITCTLSGTGTNEAHDTANSVSVTAGQRISLRVVTTAGSTSMSLEWAIEFDAD